jgi:D-xylose transport system permease protein
MKKLAKSMGTSDWRIFRSIIALVAVMFILSFLTDGTFSSARNLINLSRQVSINGILAIGMTYVILIGGIDLSVGSIVAVAGIVAGILQVNYGLNTWGGMGAWYGAGLSILAAIVTGLACGIFNGFLITRFNIASFIITLGMMVIARGMALILAKGAAIAPLSDAYNWLGQGFLSSEWATILMAVIGLILIALRLRRKNKGLGDYVSALTTAALCGVTIWACNSYRGLPIPVLVFGALGIIGSVILMKMRLGRFVLAIGGNPNAAWLAGVPIRKISFWIYAVMGALAGLCGGVLSARLNGALPTAGDLFELDAIAAVVIGGTSLTGGVGTVRGSILGAFFMGALDNGMSLLNITEFYQKVIKGLIIIIAVWADTRERKQKAPRKSDATPALAAASSENGAARANA